MDEEAGNSEFFAQHVSAGFVSHRTHGKRPGVSKGKETLSCSLAFLYFFGQIPGCDFERKMYSGVWIWTSGITKTSMLCKNVMHKATLADVGIFRS